MNRLPRLPTAAPQHADPFFESIVFTCAHGAQRDVRETPSGHVCNTCEAPVYRVVAKGAA